MTIDGSGEGKRDRNRERERERERAALPRSHPRRSPPQDEPSHLSDGRTVNASRTRVESLHTNVFSYTFEKIDRATEDRIPKKRNQNGRGGNSAPGRQPRGVRLSGLSGVFCRGSFARWTNRARAPARRAMPYWRRRALGSKHTFVVCPARR